MPLNMSLDESIVMSSAISKKKTRRKPLPKSPTSELLSNDGEEKKPTTKVMIHKALEDLKTRKGVSLYAIKKYMEDNYKVDTEKINHLIKKTLKSEVEKGSIIQIKGIGASGSFKLVVVKPKAEKKKKPIEKVEKKGKSDAVEKPAKKKKVTEEKTKKPQKKEAKMATKKEVEQKMQKPTKSKTVPAEKRDVKTKMEKRDVKTKMEKPKMAKSKIAKGVTSKDKGTPTKKLVAIMKRKSIGSIIKPPKMKPRKA